MHYYRFNIADYRKDTVHLSRIEHAIYRELIDLYYLDEKAIPEETQSVMRRLRVGTEEERTAFNNVLNDFFVFDDGEWKHPRIDEEIDAYRKNKDKNRANGKKGGRPKGTEKQELANSDVVEKPNGFPVGSEKEPSGNPNHKPLTTNQEPETKGKSMSPQAGDQQSVFDYWCYRMGKGKQTKFSDKRKRTVQARLKEGRSVEDIKQAIDGCASSPFHMGLGPKSDGTVYNDLELICRNNEKLEQFMQLYEKPPGQQVPINGTQNEDILGGTSW